MLARNRIVRIACTAVMALASLIVLQNVIADPSTCNGKKPKNETVNCGTEAACSNTRPCSNNHGRAFVDKGNFTCVAGTADDHCGDVSYPCEHAAGVRCTCAWECVLAFEEDDLFGGYCAIGNTAIMESDPCVNPQTDPPTLRQICSYKKEKTLQSCPIN